MSFITEITVKRTRKVHQCEACGKSIEAGGPMVRWSGLTDGDFNSVKYHTDCREAELELNDMHKTPYDEWMTLRDIEYDDVAWLRETYPAVAARRLGDQP